MAEYLVWGDDGQEMQTVQPLFPGRTQECMMDIQPTTLHPPPRQCWVLARQTGGNREPEGWGRSMIYRGVGHGQMFTSTRRPVVCVMVASKTCATCFARGYRAVMLSAAAVLRLLQPSSRNTPSRGRCVGSSLVLLGGRHFVDDANMQLPYQDTTRPLRTKGVWLGQVNTGVRRRKKYLQTLSGAVQ